MYKNEEKGLLWINSQAIETAVKQAADIPETLKRLALGVEAFHVRDYNRRAYALRNILVTEESTEYFAWAIYEVIDPEDGGRWNEYVPFLAISTEGVVICLDSLKVEKSSEIRPCALAKLQMARVPKMIYGDI